MHRRALRATVGGTQIDVPAGSWSAGQFLRFNGSVIDSAAASGGSTSTRPFQIGAAQNDRGKDAWEAYCAWIGEPHLIAVDFASRFNWSDIENPTFVLSGWSSWFAAYPDEWLMLALNLLPNSVDSSVAANWIAGASGSFDSHFNTFADNLIASGCKRLILRLDHEMNLHPIPDVNAYKTYWRRVVDLLRAKFTAATGVLMKTCWNPTNNYNVIDLDTIWPGDLQLATTSPAAFGGISNASGGDPASTNLLARIMRAPPFRRRMPCPQVDFIGVDIYDQSGSGYVSNVQPTQAQWHEAWWGFLSNFNEYPQSAFNTSSLNYYTQLSHETGTPLCVPEWGCWEVGHTTPAGGDNPMFVSKMYDWLVASGVVFACYFDVELPDFGAYHQLWPGYSGTYVTNLPRARDEYLRLF